jgi:hypothetical protein
VVEVNVRTTEGDAEGPTKGLKVGIKEGVAEGLKVGSTEEEAVGARVVTEKGSKKDGRLDPQGKGGIHRRAGGGRRWDPRRQMCLGATRRNERRGGRWGPRRERCWKPW